MRFVFHVGLHKTGSTFLQENFGRNADWLADQGVFLANSKRPNLLIRQREVLRRANNPGRTTPPEDALLGVNNRLRREAQQEGAQTLLLSEENRLGPPLFLELKWGLLPAAFYPRAGENLQRLTFGLEQSDITIVLVRRDLEDWLQSIYLEGLRSLNVVDTFEEFCASIDHDSLDLDALQERIDEALPDAELCAFDFEEFKDDPRSIFDGVLDICGVDARDYAFSSKAKRVAVSEEQADELLALARRAQSEGPSREIALARRRILEGT